MCMKYVNASVMLFKYINSMDNDIISYDLPFTSIKHDGGTDISMSEFSIITNIGILGTSNPEHKAENPLESGRTLDFIIRLTKCSSDDKKRLGYDLDTFSIDLAEMAENGQLNKACFDFFNYTRTTNIDKIDLPAGTGKYVIKVLVKDSEEEVYTIQTMSQLLVV